ncbi:MAG: hypothetical protein M3Y57_16370 [Acidobacteriota bacterium]|nr:hypothetical protein [Acidobacteriota bacterium]
MKLFARSRIDFQLQGRPYFRMFGEIEAFGHHAHNNVISATQRESLSNRVWASME